LTKPAPAADSASDASGAFAKGGPSESPAIQQRDVGPFAFRRLAVFLQHLANGFA